MSSAACQTASMSSQDVCCGAVLNANLTVAERSVTPMQRRPYGTGVYRRRITLDAPAPGQVTGELRDDFHHFRVLLGHDGTHVTAIAGEAVRFPWTTCPSAAAELRGLVGTALPTRASAIAAVLPARENCTHLYDLAGLALAHAGTGRTSRTYDLAVPDRVEDRTVATLARDGEHLLTWTVLGQGIDGPPPFAGQRLRGGGFIAWADAQLDPDTAEAAVVLRRALAIAMGRAMDLDAVARAEDLGETMTGTCYTFSTRRYPVSFRVKGSVRDFTDARP